MAALKQRPVFTEIKDSLRDLYLSDPRPWLVGFSGGKDSTMVAGLIFDMLKTSLKSSAPNLFPSSARIPVSRFPPSLA